MGWVSLSEFHQHVLMHFLETSHWKLQTEKAKLYKKRICLLKMNFLLLLKWNVHQRHWQAMAFYLGPLCKLSILPSLTGAVTLQLSLIPQTSLWKHSKSDFPLFFFSPLNIFFTCGLCCIADLCRSDLVHCSPQGDVKGFDKVLLKTWKGEHVK